MDRVCQSESQLYLPPAMLPIFRGDTEWASFCESFNSVIHRNDQIPAALKLVYLKSCVRGDAGSILDPLENTDAGYDDAWELLTLRYETTGKIVYKYVQNLLRLEKVCDKSSGSLNKLLWDFKLCLYVLKQLGELTEQWSTLLVHLLADKLDSSMRQEWETSAESSDIPSITQLVQFIEARCESVKVSALPSDLTTSQETLTKCTVCEISPCHPFSKCIEYLNNVLSGRVSTKNRNSSNNINDDCEHKEEQTFPSCINPVPDTLQMPSSDKVGMSAGDKKLPEMTVSPNTETGKVPAKKHELLNPIEAKELYLLMLKNGVSILCGEEFRLPLILTPLFYLPGFFEVYSNYVLYPDEGTVVVGKLFLKEICDASQLRPCSTSLAHNITNYDLSRMIILITTSMVGLHRDIEKAFFHVPYNIKDSFVINLTGERCKELINHKMLDNLETNMKSFPKLQAMVYNWIVSIDRHSLSYTHPTLKLTRAMLREAGVTVFHIIALFVTAGYSDSHCYPGVEKEIDKWFEVYKSLEEKYGEKLDCLKMLEPALPSATFWPNLAQISYLYIYEKSIYKSTESFEIVKQINPALPRKIVPKRNTNKSGVLVHFNDDFKARCMLKNLGFEEKHKQFEIICWDYIDAEMCTLLRTIGYVK